MLNRHLSRSIVLQTLFEWDFRGEEPSKICDILYRNLEEFAFVSPKHSFAEDLIKGILKEKKSVDNIIQKAAPQWPIDKIPIVDRNILRIGIFELLFANRDEVPPKVAINEAIELAKAFGGENSGRFISGVMGTIYKELGEPRKYETSKDKAVGKAKKVVEDRKDLPLLELGGALIYAIQDGDVFLAFVHNIFGYWALVKGSLKNNETTKECAKRESKEETGLDVLVEEEINSNEYITTIYEEGDYGRRVRKKVTYFIAKSDFNKLRLEEGGGVHGILDGVKWFELSEISAIDTYDDLRPIIEKGIEMVKEKIKK